MSFISSSNILCFWLWELQAGHLIPVQIRRRVLQILLHVYAPFYSSGSSANNKLMAFSQAQLIVEVS